MGKYPPISLPQLVSAANQGIFLVGLRISDRFQPDVSPIYEKRIASFDGKECSMKEVWNAFTVRQISLPRLASVANRGIFRV